jgi:peroxiredoxin
MKKSRYILISFLVFIIGCILALHIDSKNYENEYLIIREKRRAVSELRTKFHVARTTYREYKSQENWDYMLKTAEQYFSGTVTNPLDYNSISWDIVSYYKKHNDFNALKLAQKFAKKAVEVNLDNGRVNDTYAAILFELGYIKEAIKQQRIAVDFVKMQNLEWLNLFIERLERYETYLDLEKVEIGKRYLDALLTKTDSTSVQLSNLIENKTTLLVFWNPTIETSREITRKLIPLQYKFKDNGLQIIGISKTNSSLKLLRTKQRIKEESFQWLNLIDINSKEKIWDKYEVINSNNANFLINKKGKVISINQNANEINLILENLLYK